MWQFWYWRESANCDTYKTADKINTIRECDIPLDLKLILSFIFSICLRQK